MKSRIRTKQKVDDTGGKKLLTEAYVGSMILAAAETKGIGSVRMAELLTNFGEWLEYFSENASSGVGYDILVKHLKERNLYELFEALIPREEDFRRKIK